jgi:NADPH:quinone reductase-like Zn-dependent oxidoreductase
MGAHVTGVSSARNAERVLALGADEVIDYKTSDYTRLDADYDLIVDNVGNHSVLANRRALVAGGRMVMVAGGHGDWLGPLANLLQALVVSPFVDEQFTPLLAELRAEDLATIADMMAAGEVRSVIDRHYPLEGIAEAIEYSESGRARGKIIVDVGS